MLRHGCARAVTLPFLFFFFFFVSRPRLCDDSLSLIFRFFDLKETIWQKLDDDVSERRFESLCMIRKKFFLLGITWENCWRELLKGTILVDDRPRNFAILRFVYFSFVSSTIAKFLNVRKKRQERDGRRIRNFEDLLTRDRGTIVAKELFVRQRRSETTYNLVLLRTNPYPYYFPREKPASLTNARII